LRSSPSPARPLPRPFQLRKQLYPALKAAGIGRIELVAGPESIVQERSPSGVIYLYGLPPAALQGVLMVLAPERIGAEIDLLVEGAGAPDDPDRIWTVRRDLSGGIVVLKGGPPRELRGFDPSPAELAVRFGIGALEDTDASFSAEERRALTQALELLAPGELDLIAGTSFRRARRERHGHAGSHAPSRLGEPSRITLFDRAFERVEGRTSYVGAPEQAVPYAVFVILHQIGHVIARAERRQLLLQRREQVESYDVSSASYTASRREFSSAERGDGVDSSRRGALALEIRRSWSDLQERLAGIERLDGALEALRKGPSAMERRYATLPAALDGPTAYGRVDARESFAESFALFHTDPESLRWIAPQVHAWFAASGHLKLADPVLPEVASPAVRGE
jgi:hypothetical protein